VGEVVHVSCVGRTRACRYQWAVDFGGRSCCLMMLTACNLIIAIGLSQSTIHLQLLAVSMCFQFEL
jgi:hypothetical protein